MKYLSSLLWVPLTIVYALLVVLGLITVPIGLLVSRGMAASWPKVLWLWLNDEDGLCPIWWLDRVEALDPGSAPTWYEKANQWLQQKLPRFYWLAIRNPVNNHRFLFTDPEQYGVRGNWSLDEPMEAKQMLAKNQRMAHMYRWAGWKSGYRRVWINDNNHYSELWIGFKLGSDVPGCGFTVQYRRRRTIGT
jgi:hypothetical protein